MSEAASRADINVATTAFLAGVPLFDGTPRAELAELAQVMSRRDLAAGDVLWREGDEAVGMALIVEGHLSLTLALPGERDVELGRAGPAEVLGEVALVDGGRHSATAKAIDPATVLLLGHADFTALVSRSHPTAFAIKRRIAGV